MKNPVKTILVAIDFSRNAEHALEYAVLFANKLNACIHLIWVDNTLAEESVIDIIEGETRIEKRAYMNTIIKKFQPQIKCGEIQVLFSDSLVYDLQLFSNDLLIDSAMGVSEEYYFSYKYEGVYRVDVLNSCDTLSYQTQVNTSDSMLIDFTLSADTIYIQDGAEVYCENTSENASTYNWFFSADQEEAITETNAEHVYTEAGTFEIYLLGKSQAGCQHYINKSIVVIDLASSIEAIESESGWTQIRYSNNAITLHFGNLSASKTNLRILNELGQAILIDEINSTSGIYDINTQQLQSGIYFIQLESTDGFSEVKRFVVR